MPYITDTHRVQLRFKLDFMAPPPWRNRWLELKSKFENMYQMKDIVMREKVEEILKLCKLEEMKKMPYLNRAEGGIGGDGKQNKQIRFRSASYSSWDAKDHDIVFQTIDNTETEKWSLDELDDLIQAFETYAAKYVEEPECVSGTIEMRKRDEIE